MATQAEWTTRSHGEQSDRIARGHKAIDLAFFASATALFLRSLAKQRKPIQFAALAQDARVLEASIMRIQGHLGQDEGRLPYTDLVAVQVWHNALSSDSQAHLVQVLPGVLEHAARETATVAELESSARQLDQAAMELQTYTGGLMAGFTVDK